MMSPNHCPLCEGNSFYSHYNLLLKCKTCGLIVDRNVWKSSANEEFEDIWFGEDYNQKRSFWLNKFESWKNKRTWKYIEKYFSNKGKLLDIGVGSGSFLQFMKVKGFDVEGCDLSQAISDYVRKIYKIKMHNCFVNQIHADSQYDVITMSHVLEHTNNPAEFLSDVRMRLKKDGIVYLAVPNIASWEAKLPGWNAYEPYHLVYFSPKTLRKILEKSGLNVMTITTHESFSGWFLAILRTLFKIGRNSSPDRNTLKDKCKTSWKEHLYRLAMVSTGIFLFPLRWIQAKMGCGDEIIAVANLKGK